MNLAPPEIATQGACPSLPPTPLDPGLIFELVYLKIKYLIENFKNDIVIVMQTSGLALALIDKPEKPFPRKNLAGLSVNTVWWS